MEFNFNTKFLHPFTMLVVGPSGCGKTYFTKEMIKYRTEPEMSRVYWFYAEWQHTYNDMPGYVRMIPGMIESLDEFLDKTNEPKTLVFDDMMNECLNNKLIAELFTKKRHHCNVSIILLLQNLFVQGSVMRTVHLNTEYVVLFANQRDKSQFHHFARQVEPNRSKRLVNAYMDATSTPYSHFLVDLKTHTPDALRYRSNTLSPDEQQVYSLGNAYI